MVGRDAGGRPFAIPQVPQSVRTSGEWRIFRQGTVEPARSDILAAERDDDGDRYERWRAALPVGDLYRSYVVANDAGLDERGADDLGLPASLLESLDRLRGRYESWCTEGGAGGRCAACRACWVAAVAV